MTQPNDEAATNMLDTIHARLSLPPPAVCKMFRVAARLTLPEAAAEIGVDRATLVRWESGRTTPRISNGNFDRYAAFIARLRESAGESLDMSEQ